MFKPLVVLYLTYFLERYTINCAMIRAELLSNAIVGPFGVERAGQIDCLTCT